MFPKYAMEIVSFDSLTDFTLATNASKSVIFSSIQPWSKRTCVILGFTSAHTVMHPAILPALGCAPLIPPNPDVTNK